MAKKTVASLQDKASAKYTKVIRMSRSPKTGAYVFSESMMPEESVKSFLAKK